MSPQALSLAEHCAGVAESAMDLALASARTTDGALERLSRLETLVGYQQRMFSGILEALERDDARAAGILARTGARWVRDEPLYVEEGGTHGSKIEC